jgi:hypothetical protein
MPPKLLGKLRDELAACAAAHTRAVELAERCTAAGAELNTAASQALQVLRHLDALNHLRFAANPLLLEEWDRTATVAWPSARHRVHSASGSPPTIGN